MHLTDRERCLEGKTEFCVNSRCGQTLNHNNLMLLAPLPKCRMQSMDELQYAGLAIVALLTLLVLLRFSAGRNRAARLQEAARRRFDDLRHDGA